MRHPLRLSSLFLAFAALGVSCGAPSAAAIAADVSRWTRYHSDALALSFEYPTAFATGVCAPREDDRTQTLAVGRVAIAREAASGAALAEFVDAWRARTEAVRVTQVTPMTIAGYAALAVEYRNAGTARAGVVTFVKRDDSVVRFGFDSGAAGVCGPASAPATAEVYERIARSLRFDE